MVFSDQAFVFLFLPIALAFCLSLSRTSLFDAAVLISSLTFFYWTSGTLTLILIASILLNYLGGRLLEQRKEKWLIATIVALNFAVLTYFKYTGFALGVFGYFGSAGIKTFASHIMLPIGISFYTFQGVSYIIDVWRGDVAAERSIVTFAAYKTFFPQLIAGPIIRYRDVHDDFHRPQISVAMFSAGASRFVFGLCKKVLVADLVAPIATATFGHSADATFASAWIGAIAFTAQIYFDFSGYSDMAIGLALMFGIRFKENFNHPYASSTVTEFWRRWHMSLSSWFRDYLYIPLGGNRKGTARTYLNLFIVFLATGIWHGAAWTFVLWGVYHGAFLIFERIAFRGRLVEPSGLRLFYFFPVIIVGWVLFEAPDLHAFGALLRQMASPLADGAFALSTPMVIALAPSSILVLTLATAAMLLQGQLKPLGPLIQAASTPAGLTGRLAFAAVGAAICAVYILPQSFSPFLYFRF